MDLILLKHVNICDKISEKLCIRNFKLTNMVRVDVKVSHVKACARYIVAVNNYSPECIKNHRNTPKCTL